MLLGRARAFLQKRLVRPRCGAARQLSGAATRGSSMRMTRSVCGFGSAPCAILSWPAAALYSQADLENEDATIAGAVLGDWVGGPGLRGAGLGGDEPGP